MKKIFTLIMISCLIAPMSQLYAKTDQLICAHEPESMWGKWSNYFTNYFSKGRASTKDEILVKS